jgi:2'-5' RNA ligase
MGEQLADIDRDRSAELSLRLFFAVELPREVQTALGRLMPRNDDRGNYRWVNPELLHVTLAFLGQQPADRLQVLREVAQQAASTSRDGQLRLGIPGGFPPRGVPRVLWMGLDGDLAALTSLQQHLASGLSQAGFTLEDRAFSPHITLARRRQSARGGAPAAWPPPSLANRHDFAMDKVTLFESRLSPRGASYFPLDRFQLH